MKRLLRPFVASVVGVGALLVGPAAAGGAPGGGAIVVPTTCLITLPGFGTATGPGTVTILPTGAQVIQCSAQLPPAATLPTRAVRIENGSCVTIVTPSGHVIGHCRP
jgi:hypothetical protein